MDRDTFVFDENWHGSYYELCIELGPTGDDKRLCTVLELIWSQPQLQGSWASRCDYNSGSLPIECCDGVVVPRYGIITLSPGVDTGCITLTVREPDGSDWLDLCIPTGMLELCFDLQYPLDYATNPWMYQVDKLLSEIAASVFREIPFHLGIIGEEASGVTHAASITPDDCRYGPILLPDRLWNRLKLFSSGQRLAPGLWAVGLKD